MWILTYAVNDYNQYGEYHQRSWSTKPEEVYLACYLKHAEIVDKHIDRLFIKQYADKLINGEVVEIQGCKYSLWEQEDLNQLLMY